MAGKSRTSQPSITLAELSSEPHWIWLYCRDYQRCMHKAPVALAPLIIRWGPNATRDRLCASFRCSVCGHRGADTFHVSISVFDQGWQPFPVDQITAYARGEMPAEQTA